MLVIFIFFLYSFGKKAVYSQTGSYSTLAQKELDGYATANPNNPNNLDVFKFSIKEILDSNGESVLGSNNKPTLYGKTDYGSEFTLENDLDTSFKIEIPAFVIDALAEDTSGEYYPVIINGDDDDDDGNYVESYRDNSLAADINKTYNESGPNIIQTNYDTGRKKTQYLWDDEVNVINNINADNTVSNFYNNNDVFEVYKWTGTNGDSYTNHSDIANEGSVREYVESDGKTGFIYTDPDDEKETYEKYSYADGRSGEKYTETGLEIKTDVTANGTEKNVSISSSVGTYSNIKEVILPSGASTIEFDSHQLPAIQNNDGSYANTIFVSDTNPATDASGNLIKIFTNGANSIQKTTSAAGLTSFKYNGQLLVENIESIFDTDKKIAAKNALIETGASVVTSGDLTIAAANSLFNFNSSSIDFKDQYDTVNGQTIVPEKGFVKLIDAEPGQYINLENGDIVEFFVRPSNNFSDSHNADSLFYIDRPIPTSETETETVSNETGSSTTTTTEQNDTGSETIVNSPVEEAVDQTTVVINYVTAVYVSAPASNFNPSTIVVPVQSDGDYVSGIIPGPSENFPSEIEVVAITPTEAKRIIKKIEEAKKAKAEENKYIREKERPGMDDELKGIKALNDSLLNAQKTPGILVQNTKKIITDNFPNFSNEFLNFLLNNKDNQDRFELISDPIKYLNDEFRELDKLLSKNSLSSSDFTTRQLIKFNYLMEIKFANQLSNLGLPQNKTKIIFVNSKIELDDLIKKQSLQEELLPLISLITPSLSKEQKIAFLGNQNNFKKGSSSELFEKKSSKEIINKIKFFTSLIDESNNQSAIKSLSQTETANLNIPLVEINVNADQNIKDALENKMNVIKSLNRPYQTKPFKETLEKFDFEIPDEKISINIGEAFQVAASPLQIPARQLELMAEATEASDNLVNETIDKMLAELGYQPEKDEDIQLFSNASDVTNQEKVTNLLQIANERTKALQDIRAIFETMGLGS